MGIGHRVVALLGSLNVRCLCWAGTSKASLVRRVIKPSGARLNRRMHLLLGDFSSDSYNRDVVMNVYR